MIHSSAGACGTDDSMQLWIGGSVVKQIEGFIT